MKKQLKKLGIATLYSSSVFAITYYFYRPMNQNILSKTNEKPLAYVGKFVDDIQRRPASRLLWVLANTGEPLFNGEAVRTSEHGEVRIQFADTDRYLDLEPDSLIVIKKSEGEIALDLLEGSLFVNSKDESKQDKKAPAIIVTSSAGKIDLTHASANISKKSGKSLDVHIVKGNASFKNQTGQTSEIKTGHAGQLTTSGFEADRNNIKIISPVSDKPIMMDSENLQAAAFKWSGFPSGSEVSLWVGSTRKDMKFNTKADAGKNEISSLIPFGDHYWKLVATNSNGEKIAESPTYKLEILPRYAPTVNFPSSDLDISSETIPAEMSFKWQKGEETSSVALEVWSDSSLTNRIANKSFSSEESFTLSNLKSGIYYWRMSSYYPDSSKPILGKIQKFSIQKKIAVEKIENKIPAVLKFDSSIFKATQFFVDKPTFTVGWKAENMDPNIKYAVRFRGDQEDEMLTKTFAVNSQDTQAKINLSSPGRYIVYIEASKGDGTVVAKTPSQEISVSVLPTLRAPSFVAPPGNIQVQKNGQVAIEWTPIDGSKEYVISLKKNGKEIKQNFKSTKASFKNLMPGEYMVEVTAMDTYNRLGQPAPARKLVVPANSGLRAPASPKILVR